MTLLQHHCLTAALTVAHFEVHLFTLLDILAARPMQDGRVQEDVLATVIGRDEAEAAHLVEPLHGAIDGVGRPTRVAVTAEVATRRRPIPESAGRAITKTASATATEAATTTTTEVAPGRTITETAAATEIAPRRTIAEAATTTTEVAPRGPVTEGTRGTIAEPATTTEVAPRRPGATTLATLQLNDPGDKATALAVRADFADEGIAAVGRFDASLGQRRGVEEDILTIGPQHEAEALSGVVPLHFGRDRPGIARHFRIGRHLSSYPYW